MILEGQGQARSHLKSNVPWSHKWGPVHIWQFMRGNWLSNLVFETYDDIIDAACDAWRKLIAQPETITSIGMREWVHIGQTP